MGTRDLRPRRPHTPGRLRCRGVLNDQCVANFTRFTTCASRFARTNCQGRATVPTAALESAAIGIWTRDSQPNARRLCDSVNDLYLNLPPLKSGETRKKKIIMETRRPVQVRMTAFADGSPLPNCRIEVALESSIIPADRRRQAASAKSESMPRTAQKSTTDRSGTAEYEIEEFSTYAVSIEKNGFNPAYFSVDFSDGVAGTPMKVALHQEWRPCNQYQMEKWHTSGSQCTCDN